MKAGTLTLVVRRCNSHEKNVIGIAQINGLNITKKKFNCMMPGIQI